MTQRQLDDELTRESPSLGTKLSLRHLPQVREMLNEGVLRCDIWGGLTSKSRTCRFAGGFWSGVWAFFAYLWGRNLDAEKRLSARVMQDARRDRVFAETSAPNGTITCSACGREHGRCSLCLSYRGACTTCSGCGYQARVEKVAQGWRVHCGRQPAHDLTFTELPARAEYELGLCDGCRPHVGDWYRCTGNEKTGRIRVLTVDTDANAPVVEMDHFEGAGHSTRGMMSLGHLIAAWKRADARQCICDGSAVKQGNVPCHT